MGILKRLLVGLVLLCCVGILVTVLLVVLNPDANGDPEGPAELSFEQRVDRAIERGVERLDSAIRLTDDDKRFLLQAARTVLENYFSANPKKIARKDWKGVPPNVAAGKARLFVTLIVNGKTRGCMSGSKGDLLERTIVATERTILDSRFGGVSQKSELPGTRVDITLLLDPQDLPGRDLREISEQVEAGIHGISLEQGRRRAFFKSSVSVTHSYDLKRTLEQLGRKAGLGSSAYRSSATKIRKYPTVHFAESPVDKSLVKGYRYNVPIRQSEVTREAHVKALRLCGDYMANHADEAGLLTYDYDVYRDEVENPEKPAALIRRLAGTWVLASIGAHLKEKRHIEAARRSIDYSLKRYYREDKKQGFGYLQLGPDVNLATASFALLCLAEIGAPNFRAEEAKKLTEFIFAMEDKEKGCLNPVYLSDALTEAERQELFERKEAYYPGEALTALMTLYEKTQNRACLDLARRVFDYYAKLYERTRKKASFTPWQSKAYTMVFLATKEKKYADFVLKMNDRLLEYQHGPDVEYVDRIGSYFSAGASFSAGVMIESVIEAYRVAKALKDEKRMKTYRESILLGNRFLIQCQYRPENMFTARNRGRALGGVRTSIYESSVRIDAVQHTACALQKTLVHVFK